MKRLTQSFAVLSIWVLTGLALIVSGCGSLIPTEQSKKSQLDSSEETISNFPTNIGLLEINPHNSKLVPISIPEELFINKDEEIIFPENLYLKSQEWVSGSWKNMKRGATDSVKFGYEHGPSICAFSASIVLALLQLVFNCIRSIYYKL